MKINEKTTEENQRIYVCKVRSFFEVKKKMMALNGDVIKMGKLENFEPIYI